MAILREGIAVLARLSEEKRMFFELEIKKAGILAGLSLTKVGEILRVGAACPER